MTERHKHADLIIAWANGATIQVYALPSTHGTDIPCWLDADAPSWRHDSEYRIKPQPKPDVVKYRNTYNNGGYNSMQEAAAARQEDCLGVLKFTYDGETGKLKHVEIVGSASKGDSHD